MPGHPEERVSLWSVTAVLPADPVALQMIHPLAEPAET